MSASAFGMSREVAEYANATYVRALRLHAFEEATSVVLDVVDAADRRDPLVCVAVVGHGVAAVLPPTRPRSTIRETSPERVATQLFCADSNGGRWAPESLFSELLLAHGSAAWHNYSRDLGAGPPSPMTQTLLTANRPYRLLWTPQSMAITWDRHRADPKVRLNFHQPGIPHDMRWYPDEVHIAGQKAYTIRGGSARFEQLRRDTYFASWLIGTLGRALRYTHVAARALPENGLQGS